MPLVPLLPSIGIFINFTLACGLGATTWFFFGIFFAFGLLIYFCYGINHSKLEQILDEKEYDNENNNDIDE